MRITKPIESIINQIDTHMWEIINGSALSLSFKLLTTFATFGYTIILVRMIGLDNSGIYFLGITIITISSVFSKFGFDITMLRFISANAAIGNLEELKGAYLKGIIYIFCISIICAMIFYLSSPLIARYLFSKPDLGPPLKWFSLSIIPFTLFNTYSQVLKGLKKILYASVVELSTSIFLLIGIYFFTRLFGLFGAIFNFILASSLSAILGYLLWNKSTPYLKGIKGFIENKKLWTSSRPIFWATSLNVFLNWSAMIFLGIWGNTTDMGILGIASRIVTPLGFILVAVNSITSPKISELFALGDMKNLEYIARGSSLLSTILVVPPFLALLIFPDFILNIFGGELASSTYILIILAIGQFYSVATGPVGQMLIMSGNENNLQNSTVIVTLINLLIILLLIPTYKAMGAAIVTTISLILLNTSWILITKIKLGIWMVPIWGKPTN